MSCSFVNWFHLISAFLFENTKTYTEIGIFVKQLIKYTLRMQFSSPRFAQFVYTGSLHGFLITLKSVSSAICAFEGRYVNCCLVAGVALGFYRPQIFPAGRCLDKIGILYVTSSTTFVSLSLRLILI